MGTFNRYNERTCSVVGNVIRDTPPLSQEYDVAENQIGALSRPFTTLYTGNLTVLDQCTIGGTLTVQQTGDTVYNAPLAPEDEGRVLYSVQGQLNNVSMTPVTAWTCSTYETGLMTFWTAANAQMYMGLYNKTGIPIQYFSTGSPPLVVTVSGSSIQVAFMMPPSQPQTVYYRKLLFSS